MRDDVCIVLNEREPLKQQMAHELSEQLKLRSISSTTLTPCVNLSAIILERLPRVLVLDFVLGDVATALDILTELDAPVSNGSISVLLWTDEQSIQVAVNAMKLGASDFIGLGDNRSLEKILHAIEAGLHSRPNQEPLARTHKHAFKQPVGQSQSFRDALAIAESQGKLDAPVTVIYGATGSGKNTLAEFIHAARSKAGNYIAIDYDLWPEKIDRLVGANDAQHAVPMLSHRATVFIDHIEYDTGELLDTLISKQDTIWNGEDQPLLVVASACLDTAKAWQRLFKCQQINLPSLAERIDDILPLFNTFCEATASKKSQTKLRIPVSIISELAKLDWPGNVRQFRAAVVEAITIPEDYADSLVEQVSIADNISLSANERRLFCSLLNAKERWERFNRIEPFTPAPLVVKRALDCTGGNQRIAAALLGTGISQLKAALSLKPRTESHQKDPSES